MKYLSLFSGIGGFELGIQQAHESNRDRRNTEESSVDGGIAASTSINEWFGESPTCIGFSEIDKYATAIYQKHFPNHHNYGDITKINSTELPDFDLLVGGFPCQAFSIAGKRGGFDDTRGTLFFDIARILREKQPRLFLLENVKGLLSHDNGNTFKTIISTLDELGYDLQWQVLNSKNHGVPQNRERVFIVGHLRGTRRPEVFPFGESNGKSDEANRKNTSVSVPPITGQGGRNLRGGFISSTSNSGGGGQGAKTGLYRIEGKIRRLTPTECERLQGFPDNWTKHGRQHIPEDYICSKCSGEKKNLHGLYCEHNEIEISDTQRYKTLGNGVTVNVIRDIMSRILTKE